MTFMTPELLARHDRPGPRYTSYPTAVEFSDRFGPADYELRLGEASQRAMDPLSLYVHLPFCSARCSFCACHVVIARDPAVADAYLSRVIAEAAVVADRLGARRRLVQYHWGGGTPTYYSPEVLTRLHSALLSNFEMTPDAEMAVEVDPRVTTRSHLETLAALGFNRLSLGVQDLDPEVQHLIGRHQTEEQTRVLYEYARELGFRSINFDLIYGLPGQTDVTIEATLDAIVAMRPDRLAVYSFAFVPWMRPHQHRIDESTLPQPMDKLALFAGVANRLMAADYRRIGMDHFALPDDDLALAAATRTLSRNFMGYTTGISAEVIALGSSGISDIGGAYAQNHRRLASYYQAVDGGSLPIERGYRLDADDLLRREVITEIMCNGEVDLAAAAERHGADFDSFSEEIRLLLAAGGLVEEGLAVLRGSEVGVTELGSPFVRRLAEVFDVHTRRRALDRPAFSRII